jgi:hypothetical protein
VELGKEWLSRGTQTVIKSIVQFITIVNEIIVLFAGPLATGTETGTGPIVIGTGFAE